jgi:hypothetical protein
MLPEYSLQALTSNSFCLPDIVTRGLLGLRDDVSAVT